MSRRRSRRHNPDPVAAIAAAIPSSVPAPIASAAVAGAASAAAKTNPGRGRGRSRRRRNCGGYRMNPGKKRRKTRKKMSPGRRAASRLRSTWKRRTRRGGRYEAYGAVVRTTKSGSPRRGRRKHVKGKGHAWTGRKGTVALYSRKTGKLWGTNPRRGKKSRRQKSRRGLRRRSWDMAGAWTYRHGRTGKGSKSARARRRGRR
jgi:hypothetical protein